VQLDRQIEITLSSWQRRIAASDFAHFDRGVRPLVEQDVRQWAQGLFCFVHGFTAHHRAQDLGSKNFFG
jgi:hypothetical protein